MRLLLKTIFLAGFLAFFFHIHSCMAGETKKLLIVHSYHPEYVWTSGITRGIKRVFFDANVEIRIFYMDTKRKSSPEQKKQAGQEALLVVEDWKPDAIITSDDNAQEFFGRFLVGRDEMPMVFCGVNGDLADYDYPASNITGILERPHFAESVALLRGMVPSAKKIALLGDDSETSHFAFKYILEHRDEYKDIEIVSNDGPTLFSDWKARVLEIRETADAIFIYTFHTVKDADGRSVRSDNVIAWTAANSSIPIISSFGFTIDGGGLCGVVESAMEQGREAAGIVRAILLDGKGIRDFPPRMAHGFQSMLNLEAARRLGIDVSAEVEEKTDIVF